MIAIYKIAFYIRLKNNKNKLKCADLNAGNPGVGGTQYLFLLTVKHLNKLYGKNYATLLSDGNIDLNDTDVPISLVANENEAISFCETNLISVLVLNANILDKIPDKLNNTDIRIFLWAHNTLTGKRQRKAAEINSIERIICVSESQYKNMSDTTCFSKCTFINNVIPKEFHDNATLSDYSEPKAVYVGSIMPQKGIHNLIEIWKFVEKKVPEAQLYIFGGADVWNQNMILGSNGVADKYYDRVIQRRINKLEHPENIHFMGANGWKKIDKMIITSRVGIVNPSHYMRDETFCMSAIEMEAHGLPIVSRQRDDGLTTTIQHGEAGFLELRDVDIANRIVSLLKDKKLCSKMGTSARNISSSFVIEREIYKWHELVQNPIKTNKDKKSIILSKDTILLRYDFILKLMFLVESRKIIDLIIKRFKKSR